MSRAFSKLVFASVLLFALAPTPADASHISGIRISQTGNTGLEVNVDVTAFYSTGSTASQAYLGTYYNAVPAIAWGDGATTPRYGYGPSTGIPLVSTSTVVNGIPARSYRGSFSHTYGATGNFTIAANTRCCPQDTPTYTLVTGTIVTTTVSTTGPFGPTTFTTSFVQNTLAVNAALPTFSKTFTPDTAGIGVPSTLTLTVDNTASTLDAGALDFTDTLPAGLTVAVVPNVQNTCTGGTVTAVAGSGSIAYSGGTAPAGATCAISVDVTSALPGNYDNTSGDLTSNIGNSGTASDSVTFTAVPLGFSKAFAPTSVGIGAPSTLTFSIDNTNAATVSMIDFADTLPTDLVIATPANAVNTCTGGTLTAVDGGSSISYAGGRVAASTVCTISVDVVSDLPGDYVNTTGDLTSTVGNSGTAGATLNVTAVPLGFTKAFAPASVAIGVPSTLTFSIDNTNAAAVSMIDFADPLPANLVIATPANSANTCTGGTLTAVAGGTSVSYSGGSVAAAGGCTISVDVVSVLPGDYVNTTGDLTSTAGNSGTATATLNVTAVPLGFTKAFDPADIGVGGTSTLTFTVDNTNAADVTTIDFVDNLPAGTEIADPANLVNGCGGAVTADPATTTVTVAGGTLAAGSMCTIAVDVTGTASGAAVNTTGDLTSTAGNSGTATATLNVNEVPIFTKAFNPDAISIGEVATLSFTVDHSAGISPATGLTFTDNLPMGMEVADPANPFDGCGGALTANPGDGVITFAGGMVAGGDTCVISVDITITSPGDFVNVADDLMSNLGASAPGTAVAALAGGTLLDIPTMSPLGLVGLAGLLALLAIVTIRRRG